MKNSPKFLIKTEREKPVILIDINEKINKTDKIKGILDLFS